MGWTDVFPVFQEEMVDEYEDLATQEERKQMEEWYGTRYILNAQPELSDIVSMSLFWKNVRANDPLLPTPTRELLQNAVELGLAKRFNPWDHYILPLLQLVPELKKKHPEVCFRVYLASDLDFLAQELAQAGNEVHVMKHSSLQFAPGGLWRFLPFSEAGKRVTVTDVDRLNELESDLLRSRTMGDIGLGAWRVPVPLDRTPWNQIPYLPFMGCQFGVSGGLMDCKKLLQAFTWSAITERLDPTVLYPGCGALRLQGSQWPSYGFDEYFMTVAAYPRLAQHGMLTFVPSGTKSTLLTLDIEYVTWGNPLSELVYFPAGTCCGIDMDVKREDSEQEKLLKEAVQMIPAEALSEEVSFATSEADPAFLFLSRGDVHLPEIWRGYFAQSSRPPGVYAHCKEREMLTPESFLEPYLIPQYVETEWGEIGIVKATLELIRVAMENTAHTHFILLSESCVPVRPLRELERSLQWDPRSRMKVIPWMEMRKYNVLKAQRLEKMPGIRKEVAHFQSQWMCLSRKDAEIILKKDWTEQFAEVFAADEAYFATVMAASGSPPLQNVVNREMTWTKWEEGNGRPSSFDLVSSRIVAEIQESGCFFARKFTAQSDIGRFGMHEG